MAEIITNATETPTVAYTTTNLHNPRTGERATGGLITERESRNLSDVLYSALDSGAVKGKFSECYGTVMGLFEELSKYLKSGAKITIGDYARFQIRLNGRLGDNRTISSRNLVHTVLTPLSRWKFRTDEINWTKRDGVVGAPFVQRVSYPGAASGGTVKKSKEIRFVGTNLVYRDGDSITVAWRGEDDEPMSLTLAPVAEKSDATLLVVAWSSTLDAVAAGTALEFTLLLRGASETNPQTRQTKRATLVA